MTDAEMFLLVWAVVATVLAGVWRAERDNLGGMLKILFMQPEAREEIFAKFDKFRETHKL